MPTLHGISASVTSEGRVLDECAPESVDEHTVGCFVAGAPDKMFEILLTNALSVQDVSVAITVDNAPIGKYFLAPGQRILPGLYVSESTTKPFKFRTLSFEGEQGVHDHRFFTWANTGSVEFSVYRCQKRSVERFRPPDRDTANQDLSLAGNLTTGDVRSMRTIQGVGGVSIDPVDKPYARFIIRYRPIEILQMQGLLPSITRSSSTSSSTAVSQAGRKRSLDSCSFSINSYRPTQRLRGTPSSIDFTNSPQSPSVFDSSPSRRSSLQWASQPPQSPYDSSTAQELAAMKEELRFATDRMNDAMQQMQDATERMNRALRKMNSLRTRIDALEAANTSSPNYSPVQSLVLPPIQARLSPLIAGGHNTNSGAELDQGDEYHFVPPEEHVERWQRTECELGTNLRSAQWAS